MTEIAGIDFLEERDRKPDLAAEQHVPEHHAAQEDAAGLGEVARLTGEESLDESPQDHLHHWPIGKIEEARPRSSDQVPMAQDHGANASRRALVGDHVRASSFRAPLRATSRKTSSSVLRPYFSIRVSGDPR